MANKTTAKKVFTIIGLCLSAAALIGLGVGATIGIQRIQNLANQAKTSSSSESTSQTSCSSSASSSSAKAAIGITDNGIAVKALSTGTDANNRECKTFSYSIEPSTANQEIMTSLAWSDGYSASSVTDFLAVTSSTSAKTVTISLIKYFSHPAVITLTSTAETKKTATVSVNLEKRFLGWNDTPTITANVGSSEGSIPLRASDIFDSLITARSNGYSEYTIDRTFTTTYAIGDASGFGAYTSASFSGTGNVVTNEDKFSSFKGTEQGTLPTLAFKAGSDNTQTITPASALSAIQSWVYTLTTDQQADIRGYGYIGYYFTQRFSVTIGGLTTYQDVAIRINAAETSIAFNVASVSAEVTGVTF